MLRNSDGKLPSRDELTQGPAATADINSKRRPY